MKVLNTTITAMTIAIKTAAVGQSMTFLQKRCHAGPFGFLAVRT
jgi:hypothetical protein